MTYASSDSISSLFSFSSSLLTKVLNFITSSSKLNNLTHFAVLEVSLILLGSITIVCHLTVTNFNNWSESKSTECIATKVSQSFIPTLTPLEPLHVNL
jgi:hypothetical protein